MRDLVEAHAIVQSLRHAQVQDKQLRLRPGRGFIVKTTFGALGAQLTTGDKPIVKPIGVS